ncbi:hypothetical protein [Methanimicrococcus blatticola]|uniref:Uncharacterized protein n=1 Tax=Methanimicrococcus blatticola TaxID=91560 RepID=A0A484F4T0_9EURY|nr:hypothetical protein [Methanimicrococcus blatticola]MBZ3936147.1 hypothetical protein [Methanimicrococcus blatticola]MCC2508390.1 hypothetical protein [Methanimicrococcus blatticola]TDQ70157.1 hypothetical protein C7391_0496 [Methanimicrococcus blatticola]
MNSVMNRIEYLYLLIGTNPLSNYVVADFFLKHETNLKEIHFIHSTEDLENGIQSTEPVAVHLKSVLERKAGGVRIFLHGIRIKDSFSIHTDIRALLSGSEDFKNVQDFKNVHLNYSGGTKEMALHSYETFKDILGAAVTFSYFDSRRNRLKEDSGLEEPVESVFLGDKVEIHFDELFELHGYSTIPIDEQSGSVFSVEFFREFLDAIQNPEFFEDYLEWREYFFDVYPNPQKPIPADGKILLSDLLPPNFSISEILEKTVFLKIHHEMPEYSFLEERGGVYYLRTEISNKQTDKLIETRKYIVGHWFEQYVYLLLKENLLEKGLISDLDLNIMIQSATKNFEIDVAMINGYELFGISCTTDKTQSLCKSKGFEILHRTKQIAGDNSKSILMTFMNEKNTAEIDADLSDILEDRLLVLGLDDLFPKEKFIQKITDFLIL